MDFTRTQKEALCSRPEISLMERQTAGEPLDDAESEKDPAFKPYWKLPDKVLTSDTQTLLQDQCLSTYSDISGGFCSLG